MRFRVTQVCPTAVLLAMLALPALSAANPQGGSAEPSDPMIVVPDDPNPPTHQGRPGNPETTTLGCALIAQGSGAGYADVTYNYEYRYTEDTNGDRVSDSNPEWVLIGVRIDYLNLQDAQFCQ